MATVYDVEIAKQKRLMVKWSALILIMTGLLVITMMIGCPTYNVYTSKMNGEAILARAQSSREVAVAEAKAKMESASLLAQADTIRAHGIARSNTIIGQSLTDAYLHWYWIDNIEKNPQAVIYVPTEANLPIMEATRLKNVTTQEK